MEEKKRKKLIKKINKKRKYNALDTLVDSKVFVAQPNIEQQSKQFSIFSIINFLNRNTDYFVATKKTVSTSLKTIYTIEELTDLIAKTNSIDFDELCDKVKKAIKGKSENLTLNQIAQKIKTFIKDVQENKVDGSEAKNHEVNVTESPITNKYDNNTELLIKNVVDVYGDNRYFKLKVTPTDGKMKPLFVKFEDENEAVAKIGEIEKHVEEIYGFKLKEGTKNILIDKLKRVISLNHYKSSMSNAVNMLYAVSGKLVGTKKIKISQAKKLLEKGTNNAFLTSKFSKKVRNNIFKLHKEEIADVVQLLTTIFMARFVFDSKYFAQIERDLSEQVCLKMHNLKITSQGKEDYWINNLIQERVRVNCTQILAKNNITNANQLLEVYNKNGTTILHPNRITCLDDLIFAVQYNSETEVKNKKLENLTEESVTYNRKKGTVKNKTHKVKLAKPIKCLDEIRKTDAYKKYYKEYKEKFANLSFTNEETNNLNNIIEKSNENLRGIEQLANKPNLNEGVRDQLPEEVAKNDAIINVCEESINNIVTENSETVISSVVEEKPEGENLNAVNDNSISVNEYPEEPIYDEDDTVPLDLFDENIEKTDDLTDLLEEQEHLIEKVEEIDETSSSGQEDLKPIIFKTEERIFELTNEQIEKKIHKFYSVIVNGKPNEQGVLDAMLNYRVVHVDDKEYAKKGGDSERLTDAELKKANKIRDAIADEYIEKVTQETFEYYLNNKNKFDEESRIKDICLTYFKENLNVANDTTFTRRNIKQFSAVFIANLANKELKELDIELYTGTNTFKKYHDFINDEI